MVTLQTTYEMDTKNTRFRTTIIASYKAFSHLELEPSTFGTVESGVATASTTRLSKQSSISILRFRMLLVIITLI